MALERLIAGLGAAAFGAVAVFGLTRCSFGGDLFGTEKDCGAGYVNVGDNQCNAESVPSPWGPGGYVPPTSDASADSAPLDDAAADATEEPDAPPPATDGSDDGAALTDAMDNDGGADALEEASADGS